jgi:hypothetical protein
MVAASPMAKMEPPEPMTCFFVCGEILVVV